MSTIPQLFIQLGANANNDLQITIEMCYGDYSRNHSAILSSQDLERIMRGRKGITSVSSMNDRYDQTQATIDALSAKINALESLAPMRELEEPVEGA